MEEPAPPHESEAGRRRALEIAWRALSRRSHTVAEMRDLLTRRGVDPGDAQHALDEVREGGYLDDSDFARRFVADRRALDGWGAERIARELSRRGVPDELVEEALGEPSHSDEIEAACAVLVRRHPQPPTDDRSRRRALGLLARRGYPAEVAYEAVRRHEREATAKA